MSLFRLVKFSSEFFSIFCLESKGMTARNLGTNRWERAGKLVSEGTHSFNPSDLHHWSCLVSHKPEILSLTSGGNKLSSLILGAGQLPRQLEMYIGLRDLTGSQTAFSVHSIPTPLLGLCCQLYVLSRLCTMYQVGYQLSLLLLPWAQKPSAASQG